MLGIFIFYFRARFFLEAPFAEVLSGLLWTAYWPLVFLFSPLFGVVLARSFFPHFSIVDSKTVQRSALCRSRRELSNEYLLAKIGVDTAENEPCEVRKFELSEMLNLKFEISKLLFATQIAQWRFVAISNTPRRFLAPWGESCTKRFLSPSAWS